MTKALKILTLAYMNFIIILMFSGSFSGYLSDIIYYLAFIMPMFIGFYYSWVLKKEREEIAGVREVSDKFLMFEIKKVGKILPLIAPFIAIVFTVSFLNSTILALFGVSSSPVEDTGIIRMLLVHALVPALFEEMLFRYIPMKLLVPFSRRHAVIYSSLFFSLIHCSFSQMPYALVAGALFMIIDIAFESVWPSVIIHIINNAASIVWIKCSPNPMYALIFAGVLFAVAIISAIFIYYKRREYLPMLKSAITKGDGGKVTYAPLILVVMCCYIAVANLIS
jgi:membrane protease YdiL (CAAX protease family)